MSKNTVGLNSLATDNCFVPVEFHRTSEFCKMTDVNWCQYGNSRPTRSISKKILKIVEFRVYIGYPVSDNFNESVEMTDDTLVMALSSR